MAVDMTLIWVIIVNTKIGVTPIGGVALFYFKYLSSHSSIVC